MNTEIKIKALAKFLECEVDDISEGYRDNLFEVGSQEYLVCTDEEADEATTEYIKDSLWAFNADFILSECELDSSGADSLRQMQEKSCESANDFVLSLVEKTCGLKAFVEAAISADGRGHFLASYDGEENEINLTDLLTEQEQEQEELADDQTLFIYRVN